MTEQQEPFSDAAGKERLNLRLIVAIPAVFVLLSLAVAFLSLWLTQQVLSVTDVSARNLLLLRLGIVGLSLGAGVLGAVLAYTITKPVRRAISEAQQMLQYIRQEPPRVEASNEIRALSALFDQAMVSFVELVQAREVLDNINEGILALDLDGRVAGMNLKAREILQVSLADARQKELREIFPHPENEEFLGIVENVLSERSERINNAVRFVSPRGSEYTLSVKASPLELKSGPREMLGVVLSLKEQSGRDVEIPHIVGNSPALTEVLELVGKIAPTDSTVLILGESGTGKELIADAIQRLSLRASGPWVKINCAAIPEGLLESELFGHEKGAFTGATSKKPGKFELADGGTIFLDEIGDMSPSTQAKVLRVLQQREFTPVGGRDNQKVDVRIIAATNKDLFAEVQAGNFREDLFYRLNVMTIRVPPLRERKSDIPFLAEHFLEKAAARNRTPKKSLSRTALDRLLSYSWPGNVREMENVVERASLLCDGDLIQPEDLLLGNSPGRSRNETDTPPAAPPWWPQGASLNDTLQLVERELIIQALKKSRGVQVTAAEMLGLSSKNLWAKIKKHDIDPSRFKEES